MLGLPWFIGHDKDSPNYTVLYFDDPTISRVYEMSFENRIWKLWRNPRVYTTFTGKIQEDKKMISGYGKVAQMAKTWRS